MTIQLSIEKLDISHFLFQIGFSEVYLQNISNLENYPQIIYIADQTLKSSGP